MISPLKHSDPLYKNIAQEFIVFNDEYHNLLLPATFRHLINDIAQKNFKSINDRSQTIQYLKEYEYEREEFFKIISGTNEIIRSTDLNDFEKNNPRLYDLINNVLSLEIDLQRNCNDPLNLTEHLSRKLTELKDSIQENKHLSYFISKAISKLCPITLDYLLNISKSEKFINSQFSLDMKNPSNGLPLIFSIINRFDKLDLQVLIDYLEANNLNFEEQSLDKICETITNDKNFDHLIKKDILFKILSYYDELKEDFLNYPDDGITTYLNRDYLEDKYFRDGVFQRGNLSFTSDEYKDIDDFIDRMFNVFKLYHGIERYQRRSRILKTFKKERANLQIVPKREGNSHETILLEAIRDENITLVKLILNCNVIHRNETILLKHCYKYLGMRYNRAESKKIPEIIKLLNENKNIHDIKNSIIQYIGNNKECNDLIDIIGLLDEYTLNLIDDKNIAINGLNKIKELLNEHQRIFDIKNSVIEYMYNNKKYNDLNKLVNRLHDYTLNLIKDKDIDFNALNNIKEFLNEIKELLKKEEILNEIKDLLNKDESIDIKVLNKIKGLLNKNENIDINTLIVIKELLNKKRNIDVFVLNLIKNPSHKDENINFNVLNEIHKPLIKERNINFNVLNKINITLNPNNLNEIIDCLDKYILNLNKDKNVGGNQDPSKGPIRD